MTRLNQVLPLVAGEKARAQQRITELHQKLQKPALLDGIERTYRPKDEEGERLPPESKRLQLRVTDCLQDLSSTLVKLFDAVATQDFANCEAKADVYVDGTILLANVPATHLLFLEKQLVDLRTFFGKLPTLDPAHEWQWNSAGNCYATPPSETMRTKKVFRNHLKYEATKEHPAQVEVYSEDVAVGYWTKIDFCGAVPESAKAALLARVSTLQDAVRVAREEANMHTVTEETVGNVVFDYLLGAMTKTQ